MRWVKATFAIVSALICVAALVKWVASYAPENLFYGSHRGCFIVASSSASSESLDRYGGGAAMIPYMAHMGSVYRHFLGFGYVSGTGNYAGSYALVAIPYWFIVLLSGMGPVMWWRGVRRRRAWVRGGRCLGCGYDLRGTPDHCPECGWSRNGPASVPAAEPLGSHPQS